MSRDKVEVVPLYGIVSIRYVHVRSKLLAVYAYRTEFTTHQNRRANGGVEEWNPRVRARLDAVIIMEMRGGCDQGWEGLTPLEKPSMKEPSINTALQFLWDCA